MSERLIIAYEFPFFFVNMEERSGRVSKSGVLPLRPKALPIEESIYAPRADTCRNTCQPVETIHGTTFDVAFAHIEDVKIA